MKAFLDGTPVKYPNDTLLYPTFTLRQEDANGDKVFNFTDDLEFEGEDRDYIYSKLVTDTNALNNTVILKFVDDCCSDKVYQFLIKPESLKWCDGDCKITAAATEYSESAEKITCLKNTLIFDNYNGFQSQTHPKMSYCLEVRPSMVQDLLIILVIATNLAYYSLIPIVVALVPLFFVINLIINFINNLEGSINNIDFDGDPSTNVLQEYLNFITLMNEISIGCGRKHPSPKVRSYANNFCGKCGLTFQSSIFNNPASDYYETVYMNAPVIKGNLSTDASNWIDKNKPLLNGEKFLNELKGIHNAKWNIENSVLIFERRDFFTPSTPWLDLTQMDSKDYTICYNWTRRPRYSYALFMYQKDAVNWIGAEASDRWGSYVEWNNPYSPLQKDEFRPLFAFSPCRFRDDGIDRDVLSDYKNAPFVGNIIQNYDNVILMNEGKCYTPMLLIWDSTTGYDNSKVRIFFPPGNAGTGLNQCYNYAYWFDEGYPGNMYDRFWAIDNPRTAAWQGKDFSVEVFVKCATQNSINLDGQIMTPEGLSTKIISVEINTRDNKLTITGTL